MMAIVKIICNDYFINIPLFSYNQHKTRLAFVLQEERRVQRTVEQQKIMTLQSKLWPW